MRLRFLLVVVLAIAAFVPLTARAATFTVTTSADSGPGSLRDAITQANATPGRDEIRVASRLGPIAPASPLPHITEEVVVAGLLEINGSAAGAGDGLVVDADDVSLQGVSVVGFAGSGIVINGSRASLYEVGAGYNVYSTTRLGNGGDGLVLAGNDAVAEGVYTYGNRNGVVISGRHNTVYGFGGPGGSTPYLTMNRDAGIWVTPEARANVLGRPSPGFYLPEDVSYDEITSNGNGGAGLRIDGLDTQVVEAVVSNNGGDGILALGDGTVIKMVDVSDNARNGVTLGLRASVELIRGCNNAELLIDVRGDGPTPNDVPDVDGVVNAPRLTSLTSDGTVYGTLDAVPNTTYRIGFTTRMKSCDEYGGPAATVITDASGHAQFRHGIGMSSSMIGERSFATRLDATGRPVGSSELSPSVAVTPASSNQADLAIEVVTRPAGVRPGEAFEVQFAITNNGPATASFSNSPDASGGARLRTSCCNGGLLGPGETTIVIGSLVVTGDVGTNIHIESSLSPSANSRTDPNPANNSVAFDIPIVQSVPTLSPFALALLAAVVLCFALARIRA